MQLQLTEPCNTHPCEKSVPWLGMKPQSYVSIPICSLPKMYCKLFITIIINKIKFITIPTLTEYCYDMIWCTVPRSLGVLPSSSLQWPHGVLVTMVQTKQTLLLRDWPCAHSLLRLGPNQQKQRCLWLVSTALRWWCLGKYMEKQVENLLGTHKTIQIKKNKTLPAKDPFAHQLEYLKKTGGCWEQNLFCSLFLLLLDDFSFWGLVSRGKSCFQHFK